jgi:uncharacterized membrane protein (DUF373 family)
MYAIFFTREIFLSESTEVTVREYIPLSTVLSILGIGEMVLYIGDWLRKKKSHIVG